MKLRVEKTITEYHYVILDEEDSQKIVDYAKTNGIPLEIAVKDMESKGLCYIPEWHWNMLDRFSEYNYVGVEDYED